MTAPVNFVRILKQSIAVGTIFSSQLDNQKRDVKLVIGILNNTYMLFPTFHVLQKLNDSTRFILRIRRALFACFSFLSSCLLARFRREVENRRHRVFLQYKPTRLKRGLQQTPYRKILLEAVLA